jgi:DNA polymerase-1
MLFFDIETHDANLLWDLPADDFFRLGGYAWNSGPVALTASRAELIEQIRRADVVVGHNIHAFDLIAVFGKDSIEPLEMARDGRILDTWTHATLAHPAPSSYVTRAGVQRFARTPEEARSWFALDNQAYQLGVSGKSHDLAELAKEFGGYGEIPVEDPRYRDYLTQDVTATRDVCRRLWRLLPPDAYGRREQFNAAIDAQNSRNGWRVDVDRAKERVRELEEIKRKYMTLLSERYGMPTTGKAPLRTTAGKAAVLAALESVGVSADDLPRTKGGAPSLGGQALLDATVDASDEARELARAVATIGGLRPLAQSALDHVQGDGRVHPDISTLQRSGRKSTTRPGLTVWTSRGEGAVEKSYFIPNADDEVLVELDYSQADARIVAAYSGDEEFAKRFAPGADAHMLTAWAVWGRDVVGEDRSDPATEEYRQTAKGLGHAYAFRAGPRTLAKTAKQPLTVAEKFVREMQAAYGGVTKWQDKVTREGRRGSVRNAWGRRMIVERDREWTQAPALYGQSGTREIVVDALIRLAERDLSLIRMLVAQVHDALVFSIPRDRADEIVAAIRECMETYWQPPDGSGQRVHFPVGVGPYASDWQEAGH